MIAYEITYKLGKYGASVLVQAEDARDAQRRAREAGMLPMDAEVVSVQAR